MIPPPEHPLEPYLRSLTPKPLSPDLPARLAADIAASPRLPVAASPSPLADRCLTTALTLAAAAALLILALLISAFLDTSPGPVTPAAQTPTLLEHQRALAQAADFTHLR